ncbi:polyprenyl synthetase family protein [Desulforhopalus sp. 52FAK]
MRDLLEVVKKEAAVIDRYMREDLGAMQSAIDPLLNKVLEYGLFNGGKRLRPMLVVTCARLCGMTSVEVYRLAIAFEYLHGATLFHDDIIDDSATRRGKAAVHKQFGVVAAILGGDFLHAHSMATVSKYAGAKGLASFCTATMGMVDGEFMQLQNADKHNLSEIDYYNAIMGKTGLLIASSCEVGGIYAGADDTSVAALRSYGEHLGCAFQIIDDILDYLGDSAATGKAVGNDLAEGKMTLPLIIALTKADESDRQYLMEGLSSASKDLSVDKVIDIIEKYEGFTAARNQAELAIKKAFAELELFSGPEVQRERDFLQKLGQFVLKRNK